MLLAVLALLSTILLVIFLLRKKIKLGIVMLGGALLMALFGRLPPVTVLQTLAFSFTSPETIKLVLAVIGITSLGALLKATGMLDEMILNFRELVQDVRLLIALIPALVGLLAVPGGAVMSAPLLEKMGAEIGLDRDSLAAANVIFRHINTYAFPTSPGMILISSISGIDITEFLKFNIPIMVVIMPLAFFYVFRGLAPGGRKGEKGKVELRSLLRLLLSLFPFIIIILLGLVFKIYFPLAILLGGLYVVFLPGKEAPYLASVKERFRIALGGIKWDMVLAIVGVVIFKDIVAVTGFLNEISLFLVERGAPLVLLAVLFPFLAGLITGNSSAAIGLTTPLFLSVIPAAAGSIPYYNLVYIAAATSYLTSPFHMCLLLTAEYYQASIPRVIKQVAFVSAWILAASLLRFALLV